MKKLLMVVAVWALCGSLAGAIRLSDLEHDATCFENFSELKVVVEESQTIPAMLLDQYLEQGYRVTGEYYDEAWPCDYRIASDGEIAFVPVKTAPFMVVTADLIISKNPMEEIRYSSSVVIDGSYNKARGMEALLVAWQKAFADLTADWSRLRSTED